MLKEKRYSRGEVKLNFAEGPNTGPPLLLLHGLTDRWQFFQPIISHLIQRWHVYALDLRGHGNSSHTQPYRYIDYIDDTIAFLENVVKEKTSIYGASLGGMISLMVAAHRPEYVKVIVFGDANIKIEKVHKIMKDYHTFWSGWEKLAHLSVNLDEFVQMVAEMPIDIPWRKPGKYGDDQDFVTTLNKAIYLKNLDPAVLTPWANGGKNYDVFTEVIRGYDSEDISKIKCPILFIQGNMEKGAILSDDEVEYALKRIPQAKHIYMHMYGHNLGCYSWDVGPLLRVLNTFLEAHRS